MFRLVSVCLIIMISALPLYAAEPESGKFRHGAVHFETCLKAVMGAHAGTVIKVEMKEKQGSLVYEFNVRDNQARDWDVECHADSGEIIETESEVTTPLHPRFQNWLHIDEDTARERALSEYPGSIVETEYEIEMDGRAVYEFDILQADGQEWKIEIDAATGEVHEASREYWQIGYE